MGGWEGSDRKARLPQDWPARRAFVLKRCGGRCEIVTRGRRCGRRAVDVDHIVAGDDHAYSNLQGICVHHHRKKTAVEGQQAKAANKAKRFRPPERHPGDLT